MRTIATDENNDWFLDSQGNLSFVTGIQAVSQSSKNYGSTKRGEMIHSIEHGVAFFDTAFDHAPSLSQFEASVRRRLSELPDLVSILNLSVNQNGEELSYTATLETVYGTVNVNG